MLSGGISMKGLLLLTIAACLSFRMAASAPTQPQGTQYVGQLSRELAPTETIGMEEPMHPTSDAERNLLPLSVAPEDQVFIGSLAIWTAAGLKLAFVRPKGGSPFLYADTNSNGIFEESERHVLSPMPDRPFVEGAVVLYHDLAHSTFSRYPIRIAILKTKDPTPGSSMEMVFAEGKVDIEGRQILVTYLFDKKQGTVDPDNGWIGMDCNGDGKIDRSTGSSEWKLAKHQVIVFRVGERYVSTQSVDVASGKIVLRSHPATAYTNVELREGRQIADFPFTDFEGRPRKISEFRGKYVLLDFWATWCGPCVAEIPNLKAAYEKFKDRGFEILGIDNDEDLAAAKKLVNERGVTWPQATLESTKDRLKVNGFPTTILVDPEGKVVSMGGKDEFRGENLAATLEKVLPQKRH